MVTYNSIKKACFRNKIKLSLQMKFMISFISVVVYSLLNYQNEHIVI